MDLLATLALGFFLGMRHATDSDHVLAVTTIVSREHSAQRALWIGGLWGLGHTLTILSVGGAIVLFGLVIPPRVGLSMEMSVAVMLIVLGVMNLGSSLRGIERIAHDHTHPGGRIASLSSSHARSEQRAPLRPLIVGSVHGLAGSAAVALLVLATIKSPAIALVYLSVFGAGTLAGMTVLTLALAWPIAAVSHRFRGAETLLARVTGVASIAFGLFLAYRIGIVDGLLLGAPSWQPH